MSSGLPRHGAILAVIAVVAGLIVGFVLGYAVYAPRSQLLESVYFGRLPVAASEHIVKTSDGLSIYVLEKMPVGVKPRGAVVLVHWVKTSHVVWDPGDEEYSMMDYLARRGYAVYALDLRGYGKSSKPSGVSVRGETCARDVEAAVRLAKSRAGVSKVSLVGLSFGTVVSVTYAGTHPEDVSSLVLLSYPYKAVNEKSKKIVAKLISLAESGTGYIPWSPANPLLYTYDEGFLAKFSEASKADTPKIPTGPFLDLVDYPASRYVPKIRAPTLLVYGDHDPFCDPDDEMAAFKDLGSEAKNIVVVGNASHGLVLEKLVHKRVFSLVYWWVSQKSA